jgi:Ca2+-binding RTX toxin-like protein
MTIRNLLGARHLGVAATAAVGISLAAAAPAFATPPDAESASVANETLTIIGTSHNDRIAVSLAAGDINTVQVDFGDDGSPDHSFDRRTFTAVAVFLRSGADQFRVNQSAGAFADEAITVNAGSGDDTIIGGDGNERFVTGSGDDFVDGNRGADTAFLGAGRDSFQWDPGDGSDVVNGDAGTDTLVFNGANGAETMSLSPNGGQSVFLRDPGTIRMDMDDVEQLDLFALGGVDEVTINDMTGTGFRLANVDLSAVGGGGDAAADLVTVNGTNVADRIDVDADGAAVDVDGLRTEIRITGAENPSDRLQVNSLDGNDRVDVADEAAALIGVAVDLGGGQR